jgi:hypothetical protein
MMLYSEGPIEDAAVKKLQQALPKLETVRR